MAQRWVGRRQLDRHHMARLDPASLTARAHQRVEFLATSQANAIPLLWQGLGHRCSQDCVSRGTPASATIADGKGVA
jgi:hypothetical protein